VGFVINTMFKFENEEHFMNTCRKFLRESYYIYNSEFLFKVLLRLSKRVWKFCNKNDYMEYCYKNDILPATNQFTMDLKCAKSAKDFRFILFKISIYFRDPKFNEEFETYNNVGSIKEVVDKCGVYKLFDKNKKLVYVGKSINLGNRLHGSLKERKCLFFSYALVENKSDVGIYEAYYISKYKPEFNTDGKYDDALSVKLPELKFSEILDLRDFVKMEKYEIDEAMKEDRGK